MPTNDQDLRALTYLARRLRDDTHGCNQWDEAGTFACLKEALAGQNLHIACQRVLGHATDPEAKTPGAIKRPFTPEPTSEPARVPYDPRKICHICGHGQHEHHQGTHDFLSVEAARARATTPPPAAVREALTATAAELCRHGVARDHCAEHDPRRNLARDAIRTTPQPTQVAGAETEES